MTRYARSKGSKASNERIPNDATPWYVMKRQLEENLSKKQQSLEKIQSVKDKQDVIPSNNAENVHNSWAEFPNISEKKNNSLTNKIKKKHKIELNVMREAQNESCNKHVDNSESKKNSSKRKINELDNSMSKVKCKKHKKDKDHSDDISSNKKEFQVSVTDNVNSYAISETKKKYSTLQVKNDMSNNIDESQQDALFKCKKQNMKGKKSFNRNIYNTSDGNNNGNAQNDKNNDANENKRDNQETRRLSKDFSNKSKNFINIPNKFGIKSLDNKKKKRKPPKIRDDKEHKRKKPDLGPSKVMINGIEVQIVKFDGFPVKKEDADRLSDLKQKMIMRGIPQKEINTAMKLERRKAEKALAKIKKCVCFHCRKAGHNLSDCPELGSEQAGTGICFKCGSTEHTHFECKVAKPSEFRYATCFICREQGHIAKQCPDNPRGIYPEGGACKICGDVTHLKKDCPDLIKEKEENTVTVNTITNDNLESLEENIKNTDEKGNKNVKKIVKF